MSILNEVAELAGLKKQQKFCVLQDRTAPKGKGRELLGTAVGTDQEEPSAAANEIDRGRHGIGIFCVMPRTLHRLPLSSLSVHVKIR